MSRSIMVCGLVLGVAGACPAQIKLTGDTTVMFAPADEGRKILTTRDDFIRARPHVSSLPDRTVPRRVPVR